MPHDPQMTTFYTMLYQKEMLNLNEMSDVIQIHDQKSEHHCMLN
jgi:hypothetical protein